MTISAGDIFRFSGKRGDRFTLAAGRVRRIPDRYWPCLPVAASEVFHLCAEAPVLFRRHPNGWQLVVPASLPCREPILTGDRAWLPPYVPFVLRILPFVREGDDGAWSVDLDIMPASGEAGPAFLEPDGAMSEALKAIVGKLCDFEAANAAASDAVARLEAEGLLAPVPCTLPGSPTGQPAFFALDASRLARCRRAAIGALAEGSPSSIELALCSSHSLRLLADRPLQLPRDQTQRGTVPPIPGQHGSASGRPRAGLSGYALDGSEAVDTAWLHALLEASLHG